jgi:hypothetical protein
MAPLDTILHHVVLPDKIPEGEDEGLSELGVALFRLLVNACTKLAASSNCRVANALNSLRESLEVSQPLNCNTLDKTLLAETLLKLDPTHTLILYLAKQNAATLIRHNPE